MITRDGYQVSLWQSSVPPYQPVTVVGDNGQYDVIIAGGGITGVSTALLLQKQGKKCLLIEANTLCFGTTGGTTAHLNTLLDTPYTTIRKNFNAESSQLIAAATGAAIQLIRDNISEYKIDCGFEEASAFLFAQDTEQDKELKELASACMEAGVELKFPQSLPIPSPFTTVIQALGQAKFDPVKYVYGLAKEFERRGGHIKQHCRVMELEQEDSLEIKTSNGAFMCTDLVYATHIPPGVNLLHLRCILYRSYAMAVTLQDENYPEGLIYDMEDPYHYYRTQVVDGQPYLIAGGKDHKTGDEENTNMCFTQLEAQIRKIFAVKEIAYKWSSQYFEPADGLPYVGHLPGHPKNIYVATGFGGNGMVYSGVAATTITSLINKEETPVSRLLDPNRIKPVAGFTNFINHNVHVAGALIGRLFSGEKIAELATLANGEAKVVSYEGEKIALFKDEEGRLHAVNPVCTHLKCEVKWNNAERSWDCPCHGARYDYDGKVLTGPASVDVAPIEIGSLSGE
ncbi:MAG: FAD-dependent oxidoreductase [Chitinophagaceae bacterium]